MKKIKAGHVDKMEEARISFNILTGKSTGNKPLGRLRPRWEGNIRMSRKETGINTRKVVDSAQDQNYWRTLVNAATTINHGDS